MAESRSNMAPEGSIVATTAVGWVLTYAAVQRLAAAYGYLGWEARLWPLTVDLLVFVATAVAMIAARQRQGPSKEARAMALLAALVTACGNMLSADPDPVARAMHAWPACCMVAACHLFFRLVASTTDALSTPESAGTIAEASQLRLLSSRDSKARGQGRRRISDEVQKGAVERIRMSGGHLTGKSLAEACRGLGHPVSDRHGQCLLKSAGSVFRERHRFPTITSRQSAARVDRSCPPRQGPARQPDVPLGSGVARSPTQSRNLAQRSSPGPPGRWRPGPAPVPRQ